MNKKIASEIAVGVILLVAIVFGVIFWLQNKKVDQQASQNLAPQPVSVEKTASTPVATKEFQRQASGQVPQSYNDENVQWNQVPKEVSGIKLFKDGNSRDLYRIWETGEIKKGEYVGGRLLLVIKDPDGPSSGPEIFRFIQKKDKSNELYFLKDYSSNDIYSYGLEAEDKDYGELNKETFPLKNYAYGFKLPSLEYPGTIISPSGQRLKIENNFPFAGVYDEKDTSNDGYFNGSFFETDFLKFAFTDSVYGDFYTTDLQKTLGKNAGDYDYNGFYVKAPDGTFVSYSAVIDLGGDVVDVVWNGGEKNTSAYRYTGESGCGAAGYADIVPDVSENDLIVLGKTSYGESVYGFTDKNNKVLKDYYEADLELAKTAADGFFSDKKFNSKMSYDDFLNLHPMFFWKDSFGRLVRFLSEEVTPWGGCGKPVIYLYPQQKQNINVQVSPTGGMNVSDPAYNDGWNVVADPESNIFNIADGKTYPYLFWEGIGSSVYKIPQRGFVVAKENLGDFFDDKLKQEGLIGKEIIDFKEFWVSRMLLENKPFYFVTFVDRATIDKLAPLNINPQPDTTIRVLMDYKALDNPISAKGFEIKTPQRNGFTAVEWGGVLR